MQPNNLLYSVVLYVLNQPLEYYIQNGQIGFVFLVNRFDELLYVLSINTSQMGYIPNPLQPRTRLFGFVCLLNLVFFFLFGLFKYILYFFLRGLELVGLGHYSGGG
jgi:hypothetical protein